MSDRLTVADALADGKRAFNWRTQIVRNVLLATFLIALKLFRVPTTSHVVRVGLVLAIIPLMIGAFLNGARRIGNLMNSSAT